MLPYRWEHFKGKGRKTGYMIHDEGCRMKEQLTVDAGYRVKESVCRMQEGESTAGRGDKILSMVIRQQ